MSVQVEPESVRETLFSYRTEAWCPSAALLRQTLAGRRVSARTSGHSLEGLAGADDVVAEAEQVLADAQRKAEAEQVIADIG
jgi:hypothetical protein